MVDASFAGCQHAPRILALATVADPDIFQRELRYEYRDLGKILEDDDRRNANGSVSGANGSILSPHGELHPLDQTRGIHCFSSIDVEPIGIVGGHVSEGVGRRDDGDRLPLPIEH